MKKIYELTPFECYEKIFKPLFNYNIMDKYIEYGWNIEQMLNGEWKPMLYFPERMKDIKEELYNRLSEKEKGKSFIRHDLKDRIEILYKNGLADGYSRPVIEIDYGKDKEYVIVCVSYVDNFRNRTLKNYYKSDFNRRWIKFYSNGDIKKSYFESVDRGMVSHEYVESAYLSFSQTLEVRGKLFGLGVDCVNIVENDYSI